MSALHQSATPGEVARQSSQVSREEARRLILSSYQVSEEIRRERRRLNRAKSDTIKPWTKGREMPSHRTNEAAIAPQPVVAMAISRYEV